MSEFGITTREGFLETVASGRLTHATMAFDVHRVAVDGDVATVIARGRNTGSFDGVPFESDEWVTEQFVRRNGRWLCSARPQGFVASSPPRSVWPERPPVSLASCRH